MRAKRAKSIRATARAFCAQAQAEGKVIQPNVLVEKKVVTTKGELAICAICHPHSFRGIYHSIKKQLKGARHAA